MKAACAVVMPLRARSGARRRNGVGEPQFKRPPHSNHLKRWLCLRQICHHQVVPTASAQVQLGDVASWVGGGATAIALLLTYLLLRVTRREQRTLQSERRQAQARLVSAWSGQIGPAADNPIRSVAVTLQNSSDEPIYSVRAAVGSQWQGINIPYSELDISYVMPPKSLREQATLLELSPNIAQDAESSLPVELLFSDAAGLYWHRDRFGRLTRITTEPPFIGEMFFFKSATGSGQAS